MSVVSVFQHGTGRKLLIEQSGKGLCLQIKERGTTFAELKIPGFRTPVDRQRLGAAVMTGKCITYITSLPRPGGGKGIETKMYFNDGSRSVNPYYPSSEVKEVSLLDFVL